MTRRTHRVEQCLWPQCPQVGRWQAWWCPEHHHQAVAALRRQVDLARRERIAADNTPPADPYQTASIALGGTTP
jgi:hypothetical protein